MKNKIQRDQTAYRGGINPGQTLVLRGKQRERRPKRKISVSSATSCSNSGAASFPLLAQMFQGLAHWRAGNFDHASERVVHFEDNKDCARDGHRADE